MKDETESEPSLRDTIHEAMQGQESTTPTPAEPAPPIQPPKEDKPDDKPAPETPKAPEVKARDEKGKFVKGEKARAPDSVPADAKRLEADKNLASVSLQQQSAALKPPNSWKPAERESWATMPATAQAAVIRREREIESALQQTAADRQLRQVVSQTLGPYEGMIRAQGAEPLQFVDNLLRTAAALQTAPAGYKAQIVANIIKTYGVDVQGLADALDGQPPAANGQAPSAVDPNALAQQVTQSVLNNLTQQRDAMLSQNATAQIDAFAADREFFEDVKHRMGILMEAAAHDNVAMSLEEAYDLACQMDKGIAPILRQREAAAQANAATASTQRAKAAGSSIRTQPSGVVNAPQAGENLRDDIRASISALGGR